MACSPMAAKTQGRVPTSGFVGGGGGGGGRSSTEPGSDVPTPFDNVLPSKEIWVAAYGNDDNSGTLFSPKKTISAAIEMATPGTAIMVKSGKYTDYVAFETPGGQSGKPIWLRSADGYGMAELIPIFPDREAIRLNGARYIVIEGFRIRGEVQVYEAPIPLGGPNWVYGDPAVDVVVQNNIVESTKSTGAIEVRHSNSVYILGNDIQATGLNPITLNDCLGCIVDGNVISSP